MTDEAYNRRMRRSQHRRDAKRRLVRYCSTLKVEITMLIVVATVGAFLLAWVFSKTKINDWLALPVTLIVILVFTYATSRHLTDPLGQMRDAAERLSDGDYTARVPDFSNKYDEVGQLARAFNDMAEELQHEDQLRRDMIANVAHELRTPVSALQAMVENMADGVVEPNEKNMESILAQTHRLTDLISFLLDLSRIEAGSSSLNIEEFNFADFIDETIAPLKLLDSSRRYDISFSSATRTPSASAGICLATMSIATFARYILVPIPAVAVMPVSARISRTMVRAIACGPMPSERRYGVASINTSSIEYTWMCSGAAYLR